MRLTRCSVGIAVRWSVSPSRSASLRRSFSVLRTCAWTGRSTHGMHEAWSQPQRCSSTIRTLRTPSATVAFPDAAADPESQRILLNALHRSVEIEPENPIWWNELAMAQGAILRDPEAARKVPTGHSTWQRSTNAPGPWCGSHRPNSATTNADSKPPRFSVDSSSNPHATTSTQNAPDRDARRIHCPHALSSTPRWTRELKSTANSSEEMGTACDNVLRVTTANNERAGHDARHSERIERSDFTRMVARARPTAGSPWSRC